MTRENFEKAKTIFERIKRIEKILRETENPRKYKTCETDEQNSETVVGLTIDDTEHRNGHNWARPTLYFTKGELEVLRAAFIQQKEELLNKISEL